MQWRGPLVGLVFAAIAPRAEGLGLYALYGVNSSATLYEVDPETGSSQLVAALAPRIWFDIAARPGEPTSLYGVARIPGTDYVNQVSRIDVQSGAVTDLYAFAPADFGLPSWYSIELSGITIAPSQPSVATLLASFLDLSFVSPVTTVLFDLDLETGVVSGLQTLLTTDYLPELAQAPNGSLFSYPYTEHQLVTIDRASGQVSASGAPYSIVLRGIDFHPQTGDLYLLDGLGRLFKTSTTTGSTLDTIGATGLANAVRALEFVPIPEPGTGLLLALGLAGIAARRRAGSVMLPEPGFAIGLALGAGLLALLRRRR